ncbi:MAG: class II fructose-1,6-bisphosphate aldolase [Lachnospiraceae bacterium]|nr:class II fructose-1,6-bisphosphate aldolase [Lachnospiraceae bacterium]
MSLVTSKEMLETARNKGYAVGAFNVENMEMVMAVLAAAEETGSPVIMQTTPGTIKYAGLDYYLANVRAAAERTKIPVVMHLDHGNSFELACKAYRTGYTSIMIDGSKKPFEENIALTKSVVDVCHSGDVPVEGELGRVGGKEDDLDNTGEVNPYTDPAEAKEFIERTGVDTLAVGIGTSHGVYKGTPKVNVEVLSSIQKVTDIPLVMHGTSGVPDDQVRDCISRGICKVNYATDLRIAFTEGLKAHIAEHPDDFDPKKYCAPAMEKVKAYVMQKMEVVGSCGKA